jgi:hypothetical protein
MKEAMVYASRACELGDWKSCLISRNYKRFGHPGGIHASAFAPLQSDDDDDDHGNVLQQQNAQPQENDVVEEGPEILDYEIPPENEEGASP